MCVYWYDSGPFPLSQMVVKLRNTLLWYTYIYISDIYSVYFEPTVSLSLLTCRSSIGGITHFNACTTMNVCIYKDKIPSHTRCHFLITLLIVWSILESRTQSDIYYILCYIYIYTLPLLFFHFSYYT